MGGWSTGGGTLGTVGAPAPLPVALSSASLALSCPTDFCSSAPAGRNAAFLSASGRITPPSTVFAAYNHYAGPKEIAVYPFNGHEGGGTHHLKAKLAFLHQL